MLEPPSWRVVETASFLDDCEGIEPDAARLDHHRRGLKFFLERRPFEFSHGLTSPDDTLRVCVSTDHMEGAEYIAGAEVDSRAQEVRLLWLERRVAY
jgi:hypothetical protein